jgi:hypothetical protein
MKSLIKGFVATSLFLPVLALAETTGGLITTPDYGSLFSFIGALGKVTNGLVIVAMSAVLLLFFWGVAKYITAGADEEKRAAARSLMIYGVIGVFVVFSIWGLVAFLGNIFGINQGGAAPSVGIPALPTNYR